MAFSVESRLPFLDYRLVEYTFSLPTNQKINKGITKLVYRNAMKNTLPDSIINRHHKLGFITSEPIWMKSKLKQRMNTLLDEKKYKDIFNYDFIHSDYKKFLENRIQYSNTFWNFLCTEHWLNKFIN
jgi:asparagine synthase (glutamine-hydrolysing)